MKQETLKGSFTYQPPTDTYTVKVKKPYQWWWWLLLLLIFLPLFIRCERTIIVKVVDTNGNPVENVKVTGDYTAHYFLAHSESEEVEGTTDDKGKITFSGLECSLYCWLFHHGEQISFSADPPAPYLKTSKDASIHSDDQVKIVLDEQAEPVNVKVVDALNGNPIAGAEVVVTRSGSGLGTFTTDAGGMAVIPDIRRSDKLSLVGRKAGYEVNDTTLASVTGQDLMVTPPREIPLQKKIGCGELIQYNNTGVKDIRVDMHVNSGVFNVYFYTDTWPDKLEVFDEKGNLLLDTGICVNIPQPGKLYSNIKFNTRYLIFKVTPDQNASHSYWEILPQCSN